MRPIHIGGEPAGLALSSPPTTAATFNEIFYDTPTSWPTESLMFDSIESFLEDMRRRVRSRQLETETDRQLIQIKHPTDKDLLAALLNQQEVESETDPKCAYRSRALFSSPTFPNVHYSIKVYDKIEACVLHSERK